MPFPLLSCVVKTPIPPLLAVPLPFSVASILPCTTRTRCHVISPSRNRRLRSSSKAHIAIRPVVIYDMARFRAFLDTFSPHTYIIICGRAFPNPVKINMDLALTATSSGCINTNMELIRGDLPGKAVNRIFVWRAPIIVTLTER